MRGGRGGREEEDVCERGVRVPTLQADRAAVRLPGSVPGPGGSAQSRLGHRRPLLPVAVGVLLPVRRTAPGRGASVELLLHTHIGLADCHAGAPGGRRRGDSGGVSGGPHIPLPGDSEAALPHRGRAPLHCGGSAGLRSRPLPDQVHRRNGSPDVP